MGMYLDWEMTVPNGRYMTDDILIKHIKTMGFKYSVTLTYSDTVDLGETLKNNIDVNDCTTGMWTGFFNQKTKKYSLFFKEESDAFAAIMKWE